MGVHGGKRGSRDKTIKNDFSNTRRPKLDGPLHASRERTNIDPRNPN